jgi:phage host-nuclease inhibitor protein Gam
MPKRAKSAYLFFCEAKRPEVSKKVTKLGEISKELARLWAETTDRSEYIALADADKARYEAEKAGVHQHDDGVNGSSNSKVKGVTNGPTSSAANGRKSIQKKRTRVSRTGVKGFVAAKPKRAPTAYMIFCRETRSEIVDEMARSSLWDKQQSDWRRCGKIWTLKQKLSLTTWQHKKSRNSLVDVD